MQTRFILPIFAIAFAATLLPATASAQAERPAAVTEKDLAAKPDATIDFEATQVRLIAGGASGKGVLHYKGKNYPFTAKGATVGGVGVTKSQGTGTVHYLKTVEDFAGTYTGIGVGAAAGASTGTNTFQNSKGVVVRVKSKGEGVALNMGVSGLVITMGDK